MRPAQRVSPLATILLALAVSCGDANLPPRPSPAQSHPSRNFPTIVIPQPTDFVEITAGLQHTCARQYGGDLYCWGANASSQVGIGESDPLGASTPISCGGQHCVIAPTFVMKALQVEAGSSHTCALSTIWKAWCWGSGANGEIGYGSTSEQPAPQAVAGSLTFTSISAGTRSTCGTAAGDIYCWGGIQNDAKTPIRLTTGGSYVSTTVGRVHACALFRLGGIAEVECWGESTVGQTGQPPGVYPPDLILGTPFGSAVARVTTSDDFTCVDQQNGTVQCVGDNSGGQLGNGTTYSSSSTPVTVSMRYCQRCRPYPAQLHGVTTGVSHACALDAGGAAYCWGNAAYGSLGTGTGAVAYATPVTGGHTYRAIAAGSDHTCAIGTDNIIYCWGDGSYGQLGTGKYSDFSSAPKPTAALRPHVVPPPV